ncbi:MAG TPA: O-antigen ligase family protein [Alphaproteobacteria bacterium]|nr:O-antigen ligase family protein [Alphaproteobacteria bacterium]
MTRPRGLHIGHILGAAGLLALPLEVFSWPSVTPVMVAAALAALACGSWRWSLLSRWLAALCLLLLLYGTASAGWSLEPLGVLRLAAQLLGTFVAGLVLVDAARGLAPEEREVSEKGLVLGFIIGLALLEIMLLTRARLIDYVRDLPLLAPVLGHQRHFIFPVGFDPAMTLVVLLSWPSVRFAWRRYGAPAAIALAGVAFAIVLQSESMTSKVAFAVGVVVCLAARLAPRVAVSAVAATLILWIVAAPLFLRPQVLWWLPQALPVKVEKQSSLTHRLAIWGFVIERIDERPILGWGLDSSRWMPGGHDLFLRNAELLPLHPHDAALQLRLDLGIPGVLLGVCFIFALFRAIAGSPGDAAERAFQLAFTVVAFVYAALSYNLWHVWWLTMLWLGSAFMLAGARAGPEGTRE